MPIGNETPRFGFMPYEVVGERCTGCGGKVNRNDAEKHDGEFWHEDCLEVTLMDARVDAAQRRHSWQCRQGRGDAVQSQGRAVYVAVLAVVVGIASAALIVHGMHGGFAPVAAFIGAIR